MNPITMEEAMFFNAKPNAAPLYTAFRERLLQRCPSTAIQVKKTQISFINRHLFAAISFTPVKRAKERPNPFITVTFGLDHKLCHPRIAAVVEAYPHRFTHHLLIGSIEEIDVNSFHGSRKPPLLPN